MSRPKRHRKRDEDFDWSIWPEAEIRCLAILTRNPDFIKQKHAQGLEVVRD